MANPSETPKELQNLQRYYETNLAQARYIFLASLIAVIVGFTTLLLATYMLYIKESYTPGMIATAGGVLSEFICASFFYLYNKNLEQSKFLYEKLIKFQDTYWALGLANALPENQKHEMYKNAIYVLIMRNEPSRDLTPELVTALAKKEQQEKAG